MHDDIKQVAYSSPILGAKISENVAREKAVIDAELSTLTYTTENLHDIISVLESRLAPVTTPAAQRSDVSAVDVENRGNSEVYQRILSNKVSVLSAIARLQDAVDYLEI